MNDALLRALQEPVDLDQDFLTPPDILELLLPTLGIKPRDGYVGIMRKDGSFWYGPPGGSMLLPSGVEDLGIVIHHR